MAVNQTGATPSLLIYTIGHSTRPIGDLLAILNAHGITHLVDVRTIPKSRHNPQFNSDVLAASLNEAGISYQHCSDLGGLQKPRRDSQNLGWKNAGFRGFADYMETAEFEAALQELVQSAVKQRTAIMCAEALWWRCHRSLIADALLVLGIGVVHLMGPRKTEPHRLTPFAAMHNGRLSYPTGQPSLYDNP
ncbi:MAG TPA: DUF488 domain-containing protein [Nitrospiria bacterium]|nr:DUF488 domain-containing protein [Nitrospiria bacterium]